jgi:hypothetical protein
MRTEEDFGEFCKILHMTMGVLKRTLENVGTDNAEISMILVKKTLETDTGHKGRSVLSQLRVNGGRENLTSITVAGSYPGSCSAAAQ